MNWLLSFEISCEGHLRTFVFTAAYNEFCPENAFQTGSCLGSETEKSH